MDEDSEVKRRENNVIVFGLVDKASHDEDKKTVLKMMRHLSNNKIDSDSVFKLRRIGKQDTARPLLITFSELEFKTLVMKNAFLMKTLKDLDPDFNGAVIRHDLTPDQRSSLNKYINEAKAKEASDKNGFLYRVRGEVGQWRIIRLKVAKEK